MLNNNFPDSVLQEVCRALVNDSSFQFKQSGHNLRRGICPNCGERECFVDLEKPWRVSCGRLNNCQWSETTRNLYPDIFENLSKRHPASEANPDATADAYMTQLRGFDPKIIKGMYSQAYAKHKTKEEYYPAVKVIISQSCYWLRIIDAENVRKNESKAKIVGDFRGYGWIPPKMEFNPGDEIWITEGIFKSMAFLHIGMKSISGLSASNLPLDIIKANAGKNITWILAEDNDPAGITATEKFTEQIRQLEENCRIAFARTGEDWDDVYLDGRLNGQYIQESYWRGFYMMADTYQRKAFFHYCRYKFSHSVIDFNNALYKYQKNNNKFADNEEENNFKYPDPEAGWNLDRKVIDKYFARFNSFMDIKKICPCKPEFLYIEEDYLTGERTNTFYIEFANHTPSMLLTADGTIYKNADNFSNGLLRYTGFAPFTGNNNDLSILHERWFNKRIKFVTTVGILGYEPESKTYLFPDFAYCNGFHQRVNQHGFFVFGRKSLKCNFTSTISITKNVDEFNGDWINDYYHAFDLNGMVLLAWWLGTMFSVQIRSVQSSWPFLEYTGEPGSGKTLQLKFLWRCMGMTGDWEGIDPRRESAPACARKMARLSNLPTVLLESERDDPANNQKKKKSYDFSELKPLYNGGILRSIGVKTTGTETKEFIFRGGICISQNAQVDGEPAVLERIIHCQCTQDHFNSENEKMAKRLEQMEVKNLGGFLHAVLRNERKLLDGFFRTYDEVKRKFQEKDNVTGAVKNYRILHNHAQIAAWLWQLPLLFDKRLSNEQLQAVEDHIWQRAISRRERLASDHPLLEQFWDVYDYIHEKPGQFGMEEALNHSKDPKLIAINLPQFQEEAAYHRQNVASTVELIPLFSGSKKYPFLGKKSVRSQIQNKMIKCWVFRKEPEAE